MSDRVALVTGSTRGIGRLTAAVLGRAGFHVLVNGRDRDGCDATVDELRHETSTDSFSALSFDVTDEQQVVDAFRSIHGEHSGLDVLVNNAGILGDGRIGMISRNMMEQVVQVNLIGASSCLQQASRLMRRRGGGAIVNVSSIIGLEGDVGQAIYAASKAGVVGLTLAAAKELASSNIRVNAVAPGYIETEMIKDVPAELHQERLEAIPLGRTGSAEEVAEAIAFLCSDKASYITGAVLRIDGGWVL